jgi:hypothetical protein
MSDLLDFSAAVKQSRSNLLNSQLDGGKIQLYSGTRPADPDTAVTDQTLLAEFQLASPAGDATDGVWTGDLPDPALIADNGTPTWGRFLDDTDAAVADGDVGVTGSGSAIEVENTNFVAGAYASITQLVIAEG